MSDAKKGAQKQSIKVIPPKKIVRKLSVGQEVEGRVRRLADFGAFIDIGVGTDGLVHVSEIAQQRINKPSDVLAIGDQVTAWIKELDKERNRISLTMIPPGTPTIRDLQAGEVVTGKVTRIESYGIFVDIGIGQDAMVHVKEMSHGYLAHPSEMVKVGEEVTAEVQGVRRRRGQIDLSMRAVMPEPVVEEQAAETSAPDEEDLDEMVEEEEELPTSFEFALQQAQNKRNRKDNKRRKKQWYEDDEEDDLIDRTLSFADE
ncbi:MAG: S1 RNA-binding domain-containing protein [Caldilineales bacterium]|nr:S1 RNA-binding domain-containing protein [Caldilineales bacterium]